PAFNSTHRVAGSSAADAGAQKCASRMTRTMRMAHPSPDGATATPSWSALACLLSPVRRVLRRSHVPSPATLVGPLATRYRAAQRPYGPAKRFNGLTEGPARPHHRGSAGRSWLRRAGTSTRTWALLEGART